MGSPPADDGPGTAGRCILHVDMDAFFAAIELRRRPELRGLPVVVGGRGDPTRRGVVATASYEARRFGVRSGMPLRVAWRRCPEAVFLPVDFAHYAAVSEQVKAVLREFSPALEDAGLDEAFLDLTGSARPPEAVARAIKRRVRERTGLTCSIGVGPNKLLAKLASDMDKPDGLTVLSAADLERRVWPLPVRRLQGVGPKTEARLETLGVRTVGELAAVPESELTAHFGPAHGRALHEAALGIDDSPLVTTWEPRSVSRETTFQRDLRERAELERRLDALAAAVAAHMAAEGRVGRTVTVKLRYADFETHTRGLTLPAPTADPGVIARAARACLDRFPRTRPVRLLGVRVTGLTRQAAEAGRSAPAGSEPP